MRMAVTRTIENLNGRMVSSLRSRGVWSDYTVANIKLQHLPFVWVTYRRRPDDLGRLARPLRSILW